LLKGWSKHVSALLDKGFQDGLRIAQCCFSGKDGKGANVARNGEVLSLFLPKKTVNGISRMVRKGSNISELKGIMELVVFIIDLKIT
jgi:hypothetical protein